MSDILAAIARAHEGRERVRVEVPEWDCELWFDKHLTVARQQRIRKGVKPDDEAALLVNFILNQAQNEDGSKVFESNAQTRAALEGQADIKVLARIVREVGGSDTVDDAKND